MKYIYKIILILLIMIGTYNIFTNKNKKQEEFQEEKGIFISYIDYRYLKGKTKSEKEEIINEMINNIKDYGLNSIILQTNPFSDAIYPSKIYQTSHKIVNKEGDPLNLDILKYFIKKGKENNINIYAWMNPFRIRNTPDIESINENSYYYKWLNTDNIEINENGIYLNPAKEEVINYITEGIKELCENYEIKGIIFDDYFYPSKTIDKEAYNKNNNNLSVEEYRINNINKLLKESYKTVKKVNKNIKFGISPSGNIENNLKSEYLDIENILKEDILDFIIPQLYYGFNNETKPYIKTLNNWVDINIKNKNLYIALSLYKSGEIDTWAGTGKSEWQEKTDIIKKQILISRNVKNYKGFFIFRYEYLFKIGNDNLKKEKENLKNILNN